MHTLPLDGDWTLTQKDDPSFPPVPCAVPGTVQAALVRAGRLPDPLADPAAAGWTAHATWTLTRTFDLPSAYLAESFADLSLDGIDTLASVTVNGRIALRAANAFRRHTASVRSLLKRGRNTISVTIRPATPETAPHKPRLFFHPSASAPTLVTAGLFRSVNLAFWSEAHIADLGFGQCHRDGGTAVDLFVGGWVEMAEETDAAMLRLDVHVASPDGSTAWQGEGRLAPGGDGAFHATATISAPRLWWPAGMGDHPLYTVTAVLRNAEGAPLDIATARVGLRTLAPESLPGGGARLLCNGRPVFLRGAVWTPPHPLVPFQTHDDYEPLLSSARDAHFNAFRLSDAAPPETQAFFDACDEAGIVLLGAAPLGEEATADIPPDSAEASVSAPFLRHACIPDVLLGEPDEDLGLLVEGGVVSYPAQETLEASLPPDRRNLTGPTMDARTALRGGSAALLSSLVARWPLPASAAGWLPLSQIAQAVALRDRIAEARRTPSCPGLLMDPFVSAWACADGSSIDAAGRWKALQYEATRSFAPQAILGDAFLNDTPDPLCGATFSWRLTTMDGTTLRQGSAPLEVAPFSRTALPLPSIEPFLRHYAPGDLVLWIHVADADGYVLARRHKLFAAPRDLALQDPHLAVDLVEEPEEDGQQVFKATVSATAPCFGVTLSIPRKQALFSDGFFAVEPDETIDVYITPFAPMRLATLRRTLRVVSLRDL